MLIDSSYPLIRQVYISSNFSLITSGGEQVPEVKEHTNIIKIIFILTLTKLSKIIYYPTIKNERKLYHMTDISKYKNVSLSKDTYAKIDKLRRAIVPNTIISRSQTVNILVNEKVEKLNGKAKNV